jgi:hypothetical protein
MYKYNLKVVLRKGLTIENAISYRNTIPEWLQPI